MNPSRRMAMRLLASTTLISMPVAITAATTEAAKPDATLFDLYAEWQRLDQAYIAAVEAKEPAEEEYDALEPVRPDALVVRAFDALAVDHGIDKLPDGKEVPVYYPGSVERLRVLPAPTRTAAGSSAVSRPCP